MKKKTWATPGEWIEWPHVILSRKELKKKFPDAVKITKIDKRKKTIVVTPIKPFEPVIYEKKP